MSYPHAARGGGFLFRERKGTFDSSGRSLFRNGVGLMAQGKGKLTAKVGKFPDLLRVLLERHVQKVGVLENGAGFGDGIIRRLERGNGFGQRRIVSCRSPGRRCQRR